MAKDKPILYKDVDYLIDLYNIESSRRSLGTINNPFPKDGYARSSDWNTYVRAVESLFTSTSRYPGCTTVTSRTTYSCSTDQYRSVAQKSRTAEGSPIREYTRYTSIVPVSYLGGYDACNPYTRETTTTTRCACDCDYCHCDCDYCSCDCDYCSCDCDYNPCSCDCDHSPCSCVSGDCVCISLSCDCQGAGANA